METKEQFAKVRLKKLKKELKIVTKQRDERYELYIHTQMLVVQMEREIETLEEYLGNKRTVY